jgi:YD repeat-containing protein
MSQVVALPPPPIGPKEKSRTLRYLMLALLALALLAVGMELRLVNCPAGKEARQRIRGDARVRGEFGDDVDVRFALGLGFVDRAWIYGWLSGKQSHGHALVELVGFGGQWEIGRLEVLNENEGHLINLDKSRTPAKLEQLRVPGSLYFVAMGEAAVGDVSELATFFEKEFEIPSKTLPPMSLPLDAYDAGRKQWVSELLVQAMEAKYPEIEADPDARIVGVLEDDQYIRGFGWPFTFNYRYRNKYSVISPVRLDPALEHFPASPAIRMERLRKVVMKSVAFLYLGFGESRDPQSVDAFEGSTEDIDRMGSVYLASDVRTGKTMEDAEGNPCLTFFTANVAGTPQRQPILPCWQRTDDMENTQYQIDLVRGQLDLTRIDLYRGGMVPLRVQRMLFGHPFDEKVRAFGKSSWQSLDDTVWSADPRSIEVISINGAKFQRLTPGKGFSTAAKYRAGPANGVFSYALLSWENNGWRVDTRNEGVWRYLGCGPDTRVQCYYMGTTSAVGDAIEIKRDSTTGHIQQALQKTNADLPSAAAHDHVLTPTYDGDKVAEIADSDGRIAHYQYDGQEFLTDAEADGHKVHYDYDDAHRITAVIEDGLELRVRYDAEGRPYRVDFPNGSGYRIQYSGATIEVEGPGGKFVVTALPSSFRTVERK